MACRRGELRDEDKSSTAAATAAAASVVMSDALLFATMCIVGLPVDVHAKDGSIYSGIFYTAAVENDYAIVLKKARMIKKGNQRANVESGSLIETLIVPAECFVQIVAKEILLPANGITGFGDGEVIEANLGQEYSEGVEEITLNISGGHKKHKSQTRLSGKTEVDSLYRPVVKTGNMLASSSEAQNWKLDKIYEAHIVSVGESPLEYSPQETKSDPGDITELKDERNTHEIQGSNLSTSEEKEVKKLSEGISSSSTAHEDQSQKRATSDCTRCTVPSPQKILVNSVPIADVIAESRLNASSAAFIPSVPPKSSNFKRIAKASTLNPEAKIFSPSTLHHRSMTPVAVTNRAGLPYIVDTYTMTPTAAALPEFEVGSLSHATIPTKFVSYNNVTIGNEVNNVPYVQPITNQGVSRTQSVRYAGQYHNFHPGSGYVHSNPQNVMHGRVGPLVCMHPISTDVLPSGTGLYQAASQSLLTPHQFHKHQGNASAQALQLCMTPPIIANGPQQFVMPSSIPISQPHFPILRPVAIPRSNGFFNTKHT